MPEEAARPGAEPPREARPAGEGGRELRVPPPQACPAAHGAARTSSHQRLPEPSPCQPSIPKQPAEAGSGLPRVHPGRLRHRREKGSPESTQLASGQAEADEAAWRHAGPEVARGGWAGCAARAGGSSSAAPTASPPGLWRGAPRGGPGSDAGSSGALGCQTPALPSSDTSPEGLVCGARERGFSGFPAGAGHRGHGCAVPPQPSSPSWPSWPRRSA